MTYRVALPALGFHEVWRDAARRLASHEVPAPEIEWTRGDDATLFEARRLPADVGPHALTVPPAFIQLARTALCHHDAAAPSLLYAVLSRHQKNRQALSNPADPLTRRIDVLAKAVRRDIHKMHAFVRFRELPGEGSRRRFGAWFEPDHFILEAAIPFFTRRFADMDWTIATPQGVARFEAGALTLGHLDERPDLPADASAALWATYFQNIFNPARIHLKAMRSEMPKKYWKNLPETDLIPDMLANADARVDAMRKAAPSAVPKRAVRILGRTVSAPPENEPPTMEAAMTLAASCRRCGLCEAATQTVWGEGDPSAPLMLVGEQPGDQEDLAGRPFVGPAGTLLRDIMAEAGVGATWMTNAVKHFKFKPRGKRRIHETPNRGEIDHCRWWLDLERQFVKPNVTVAMGASAAYALTGDASPLNARRGKLEPARQGGEVLVTWHPSYLLRLPSVEAAQARQELLGDLRTANGLSAGRTEKPLAPAL